MSGENKYCTSCEIKHNIINKPQECKYCSGCVKYHDLNDFGPSKQTKDGKECQCRAHRSKTKQKLANDKLKKGIHTQYKYGKTKICTNEKCPYDGKEQPIENFWIKSKKTQQREAKCITCNRNDVRHNNFRRKWMKKKLKEDFDFKMKQTVRSRIGHALRNAGTSRQGKIKYLNCDIQEYRKWLESQFDENMTWDNHGDYWEIDHVVPCAAFKFKSDDDEAIYQCFNWKNTRPLFKPHNGTKKAKIDYDIIIRHNIIVNMYIIDHNINEKYYTGISQKYYNEKFYELYYRPLF